MTTARDNEDWPLRAWALAIAGAVVGLLTYWLSRGKTDWETTEDSFRLAVSAFLVIGGLAIAYTVERKRIASSFAFGALAGIVVGSIIYWNGTRMDWTGGEPWRLVCGLLAIAIAAPLFSAWRDSGSGRAIAYPLAHNRAWTNVVLWFASWTFVGVVWLLAFLLGQLFNLIGIKFLSDLLDDRWFAMMLTGGAAGAAIGLLRDSETIIGTLRRVVTAVLGVLAPVLAVGLALFLIALPVTGLSPLWEATRSTTPVLLACVIGALILSNAILGDSDADERRSPVLRFGAMVLGIAILPLGIVAAVSTGLRIQQYGMSPDRLWAVVFTGIACAYGIAYLVSLGRGRMGWAVHVRPANLLLGIGLCVVALILSTPMLSFGAIATRDQLARLADGRTKPERFDWRAVRWEFGPAGKAAVERLAKTGPTRTIRVAALKAAQSEDRYDLDPVPVSTKPLEQRLRVYPATVPLPEALKTKLGDTSLCGMRDACAVYFVPNSTEAFIMTEGSPRRVILEKGIWSEDDTAKTFDYRAEVARREATEKGGVKIEIRPVQRRQFMVDGKPMGQPFE